jgi:hypothetical protein
MNFSLIFDQVEKHFRYLIDEYGFSVVSKKLYDSFDNAIIVLQSKECRIRVIRERGLVLLDVAPVSSPEETYGLATLIAYLTKEAEPLNDEVPDYDYDDDDDPGSERQVERLARSLQRYYPQIRELFRKETFDKERADLKDLINLRIKNRWNLY